MCDHVMGALEVLTAMERFLGRLKHVNIYATGSLVCAQGRFRKSRNPEKIQF